VDGVFDRSAGFKRNLLMAQNADALIAIWDTRSRGTLSMIRIAEKLSLLIYVYKINPVIQLESLMQEIA